MERNRVTVQQAAAHFGVTEQAIRKRVKRGSIDFDKDDDGRVYVYLDTVTDASSDDVRNPNSDALISEMRARIDSLERSLEAEREANRENRRLLAAALEANASRELEAPPDQASERPQDQSSEPPESSGGHEYPETAGEPQTSAQRPGKAASWWRRIFGNGK